MTYLYKHEWLHVYTNVSEFIKQKEAQLQILDLGVFFKIFAFLSSFRQCGIAFDIEVEVMCISLIHLTCLLCKYEQIVLMSYSQINIQSIGSVPAPLSNDISQCEELLNSLRSQPKYVVLKWILGHYNLLAYNEATFLVEKCAILIH